MDGPGGMHGPGGCMVLGGGVHGPRGWCMVPGGRGVVCQHALRQTPPVNRMTNRCKNITLPQTSFAGGNNAKVWSWGSMSHSGGFSGALLKYFSIS